MTAAPAWRARQGRTRARLARARSTSRPIRRHFTFQRLGRIVTNNAASTQPPRELLSCTRRSRRNTRTCTAGSPPPRSR